MHLYLALLLHRDYFHRPDASLSRFFAPQGLLCPSRMHLYLALLFYRDYFHRPNASLSRAFAPQGLFPPAECISILLFCSTGITSAGQMHLYLLLLFHRDYFRRPNASLSCSFAPQGLFPSAKCISISLFCSTGITSASQMHLYLALLLHRDYFAPAGCISIFLFCPTGIISIGQMHLYLALLLHRDYFLRPDSSLSCFFAPQGLFPPAKCISISLFCYTGIISAGAICTCSSQESAKTKYFISFHFIFLPIW